MPRSKWKRKSSKRSGRDEETRETTHSVSREEIDKSSATLLFMRWPARQNAAMPPHVGQDYHFSSANPAEGLLLLAQSLPYVSLAIDLNPHRWKAGAQPKNAREGENLPRGFARNLDQTPCRCIGWINEPLYAAGRFRLRRVLWDFRDIPDISISRSSLEALALAINEPD